MATEAEEAAAVRLALRIAVTATACLIVSEWLELGQRALSVYSAHLAMVLFPYSAFQKTIERVSGRLLGVFYGLVLVAFLGEARLLVLFLMLLGQLVFFYVYASGRLTYAALMGGLFTGVIVAVAITAPGTATAFAISVAGQLILAAIMVILVNWISGAERTFAIETKGPPLWPIHLDWLSKAAMVSTGQIGAMLAAIWLDLPPLPTLISATILGITAVNPLAMAQKAYHRLIGALLGGGYALLSMSLLAYLPDFSVLVALVFFGMFISSYYTKVSVNYSYAFMQMGLVWPMVLIGSSAEIGSMMTAVQRLVGVVAGLVVAEIVFICWPQTSPTALPVPLTLPARPTDLSTEVVKPGS